MQGNKTRETSVKGNKYAIGRKIKLRDKVTGKIPGVVSDSRVIKGDICKEIREGRQT